MIDTHCHLADDVFSADLDSTVGRAQSAGLTGALCILSADEAEEVSRAEVVRRAWPAVQFAAGIHPHRSGAFAERMGEVAAIVADAVARTDAVALGEVGLDYHYDFAPRAVQQAVFREQLAVAAARGLPVVIHTREAGSDTFDVLDEFRGLRFVLHCFTGSMDEALAAVRRGGYVSLSGIVTFPKAGNLREVAAALPADRVLIETDAPFLAPVPHRGARNEPAFVSQTYAVVAAARGTTSDALADQVAANFSRFLGGDAAASARCHSHEPMV